MRTVVRTLALAGLLLTSATGAGCAATLSPRHTEHREDIQQHAFEDGRAKGLIRGDDDARHGQSRKADQYKEYRNADGGYRRGDSDRDTFRTAFQEGFRTGYAQAFNQPRDTDGDDRRRQGDGLQ